VADELTLPDFAVLTAALDAMAGEDGEVEEMG